jgi:hypothetical protein
LAQHALAGRARAACESAISVVSEVGDSKRKTLPSDFIKSFLPKYLIETSLSIPKLWKSPKIALTVHL